MTIIQLYTHGQTLFQKSDAVLAAGDRETVRLLIETDPEWAGFDLYAVLWRDGQTDHAVSVSLCSAGCCLIPALLLAASGTLHIALLGRDAMGRVKTSSPIRYRIRPGAPDGEGVILADVSDAAATPDQVLAGVTFYAGGEEMQTGAIPTFTEGDVLSDEIIDQLTVAADFSEGDQTVTAEDGAPMRAVTVQKPDTLVAAYIARGINIAGVEGTLPTLPAVTENDNGKTLSVVDGAWSAATPTSTLPTVTENDNGKTLSVVDGAWSAATPTSTLPAVTESDNGKVLSVVGGAWAAAEQEAAAIPFFDLAEMGLPEVPSNGTTVDLVVDTTDIRAALDAGPVKIAVNLEGAGRSELVMNKYSVDEYGFYMCTMPYVGGLFSLMIADSTIQVGAVPQTTLPDVTTDDNGKIMQVTNGVWSLATPSGGGTEIPTYDLTAMGLPTVEINGEVVELATDTTQIMSDLTSGSVKVTFALSMGGEAASVSKIVNALTGDALGGCIVTSTDALGETVAFTNFNIIEGGIVAMSYTLDTLVNPYIDAYIGDALGGDY